MGRRKSRKRRSDFIARSNHLPSRGSRFGGAKAWTTYEWGNRPLSKTNHAKSHKTKIPDPTSKSLSKFLFINDSSHMEGYSMNQAETRFHDLIRYPASVRESRSWGLPAGRRESDSWCLFREERLFQPAHSNQGRIDNL